jgi:CBS domain-containing protein
MIADSKTIDDQELGTTDPIANMEETVAADIMTSSPRTCSKFSRVIEAVMIFKDEDCGLVPVIEEGKPIGVVTDRDVALGLTTSDDLVNRPVSEIMSTNIVSVRPETSVTEVAAMFAQDGVRRLLVVNGEGQLVGVIGWKDVSGNLPDRALGHVVASVVEQPSNS